MAIRTINSPGVEIFEKDLSNYATSIAGTNFLVMGYSDKGEEFTPIQITNTDDFETNFGRPTNEAERYFYYTAKDVINNGGGLVGAKLPYNNIISSNYKYIGINVDNSTPITSGSDEDVRAISSYFSKVANITTSTTQTIATSAYDLIKIGGDFTGDQATYDFIIVNENKARIGGAKNNEGIFITIIDPIDALKVQRMFPTPSDSDTFTTFQGISYPTGIVTTDFVQSPTGTYISTSISEDMSRVFPTISYTGNGASIDPYYSQQICVLVCNTTVDTNNEGKLNVGIVESFVGSIHKNAKDPSTGLTIYIGDIINNNSSYIKFYANLNNESLLPSETDTTTILYKAGSTYPLVGFTDDECLKRIVGGNIVNNISTILDKVSNIDDLQLDVVVDAGLSTIAEYTSDGSLSGKIYAPSVDFSIGTIDSTTDVDNWRSVASELITFCQKIRKDCIAIIDSPRHLVLSGNEKLIRKTVPTNTFSNTIGNRIRYITGLNSSYAALYSNWVKVIDDFTGVISWLPPTVKVSGIYANNDTTANIWNAPAGLNRGVLNGIVDISFNPAGDKEASQLYTKSINYAKFYTLDGYILEGQKTTQTKPSAFDRVDVRRTFLRLERLVYQASRYFIYQPNNSFTRRQLIDVITPTFNTIKNAGGINDYKIICDESNNTRDVIDNNELRIAVFIKPTKAVEFIQVTFVATRTDANFNEILAQV